MRYRVLGQLEIAVDSDVRTVASPNQRLVLAALLAHPNSVVTTDALINALWDDDPPRSALSTLRTYVSRLRKLLGDDLTTDGSGYRLVVSTADIDAARFEHLLDEASVAPPPDTVELLDDALALWRGPAFGELADHPLILSAANRLEELRVGAHEDRVAALLESGAARRAVADATGLLVDHPHREGLWITLIDALLATRRAADGARAATRARAALAEAGLEPSPALLHAESRALGIGAEHSRHGTPSEDPTAHPGVTTGASNLRLPERPTIGSPIGSAGRPSTFVGRERQLGELADLLGRARIVALVGPGGVGKTRLAVELATRVASRHQLGARMIELGPLADDDVVGAIVAGLGLTVDQSPIEEVLASAGGLDVMLVLDNAEHVAETTARAVELLAGGGSSIRIVVTSRERLGVDGEHVRQVQPLASDGPSAPAQRLLRDRADAAGAALDDDLDGASVTRLVRRLDGLPLAIELAAAQLTSCSLTELDMILDDHLDELSAPWMRGPRRHQSLGALIDWSVDRLEPDDRSMLHHLTVFAGSFTIDDVVGILGHSAAIAVRRLADRSLISAAIVGARTSYRVLHVVRDRVLHRSGPVAADLLAAHARWFLARADAANAMLASPQERTARDELYTMLDELRAAHRWSTDHDRPVALALSAALHRFALSLNDEVLSWADRLIAEGARPGDDVDDAAITMSSAALRLIIRGEHERGADLARGALSLATSARARLPALDAIADATLFDGHLDDSDAAYQAMIDDARTVGDRWYEATGSCGLIVVAAYSGRAPSRQVDTSAFDRDAPPSGRAWLAYGQAELIADDDPQGAETLLNRALDLARSVSNRYIEGVTLVSLASIQGRKGMPITALATFRAAIEHWLTAADRTHQITTLRNLSVLLRTVDLPIEAAQLLGGLDNTDVPTYGTESANLDAVRQWLDRNLERDELARARADGAGRDVTDLARWALTVIDRHVPRAEPAT